MSARETGKISKRNMIRLDAKMNINITKSLSQLTPPMPQPTLPETVSANSFGVKALRKLPIPDSVALATLSGDKGRPDQLTNE